MVEVKGERVFQPACATKVGNGMEIETDVSAIHKSRKTTLELLLSRHAIDCHHCLRIGDSRCDDLDTAFCEMCFFCDCVQDELEGQKVQRIINKPILADEAKVQMKPGSSILAAEKNGKRILNFKIVG
ncbi:hypothetical protein Awo_c32410 [Acetobacterium woodii DSM 1030]|uniref:4Fe-4S His(Cys)3-ligated-type domain-containing protein n=1 Tax=Acetobacterium woodii (strain ATCC 29683 / DSM 1030 / JCM 2381 / KCTC 1655 / WB1) TaxID=931626 RepID=H6LK49_ACEWD|nr:hypothetical protein Awo_c32410 [Acetobacterium woodii DSM 1030]